MNRRHRPAFTTLLAVSTPPPEAASNLKSP
jgi:hypothetical protein